MEDLSNPCKMNETKSYAETQHNEISEHQRQGKSLTLLVNIKTISDETDDQGWWKIITDFSTTVYCCCLVTKSCPALLQPLGLQSPGFCVHGISQARILEWVAVFSSRGASQQKDGAASPAWQGEPLPLSHQQCWELKGNKDMLPTSWWKWIFHQNSFLRQTVI